MANSDSAAQNVRFNLDAQQLEFALGLDWVAVPGVGGSPASPNGSVQFNDSGAFGGSADLTTDGTDLTLVEDAKIILDVTNNSFIQQSSGVGGILINSLGSDVNTANTGIASPAWMSIFGNADFDGNGDYLPAIYLGLQNFSGGNAGDMLLSVENTLCVSDTDTGAIAGIDSSALLQMSSTTKGFLPPVMTNTQRDAIANPAEGLTIYSTSDHALEFWNGSVWKVVATV